MTKKRKRRTKRRTKRIKRSKRRKKKLSRQFLQALAKKSHLNLRKKKKKRRLNITLVFRRSIWRRFQKSIKARRLRR